MMVKKKLRLFSIIFIWILFWKVSAAQAFLKVKLPKKVYQGDSFWVDFNYSPSVKVAMLKYDSKKIVLPLTKQGYSKIILGVGAKEKKDKEIFVYWQEKGDFFKEKYLLRVLKNNFAKQYLKLPKKMVYFSKKDLLRINKEKKLLKNILKKITPYNFIDNIFWPVKSKVLSFFGVRRILNGEERNFHRGIDLRAKLNTPIRAFAKGKVILAKELFFGGNTLVLDHGLGVYSVYMHLNKFKISLGQIVKGGEVVGLAGNSGRATGPHLHFALFVLEKPVNPLTLLIKR